MADMLIPVGSIVRLEGAEFLAIVLGYYVDDGERMYDYLLAPYPAGLDDLDHAILADADGVVEIVSRGYADSDGERALTAASELREARERAYVLAGQALEDAGLLGVEDEPFTME